MQPEHTDFEIAIERELHGALMHRRQLAVRRSQLEQAAQLGANADSLFAMLRDAVAAALST